MLRHLDQKPKSMQLLINPTPKQLNQNLWGGIWALRGFLEAPQMILMYSLNFKMLL